MNYSKKSICSDAVHLQVGTLRFPLSNPQCAVSRREKKRFLA